MERHRERTKAEPLSSEMLLKERLMEMNTGGLLLSIRSKSLVVDIIRCLLPVVSVLLLLLLLLLEVVRVFLKFSTAECFSLSWVTNLFKAGKRRSKRQQRQKKKKESAFSGVKQKKRTQAHKRNPTTTALLSLYLA